MVPVPAVFRAAERRVGANEEVARLGGRGMADRSGPKAMGVVTDGALAAEALGTFIFTFAGTATVLACTSAWCAGRIRRRG